MNLLTRSGLLEYVSFFIFMKMIVVLSSAEVEEMCIIIIFIHMVRSVIKFVQWGGEYYFQRISSTGLKS